MSIGIGNYISAWALIAVVSVIAAIFTNSTLEDAGYDKKTRMIAIMTLIAITLAGALIGFIIFVGLLRAFIFSLIFAFCGCFIVRGQAKVIDRSNDNRRKNEYNAQQKEKAAQEEEKRKAEAREATRTLQETKERIAGSPLVKSILQNFDNCIAALPPSMYFGDTYGGVGTAVWYDLSPSIINYENSIDGRYNSFESVIAKRYNDTLYRLNHNERALVDAEVHAIAELCLEKTDQAIYRLVKACGSARTDETAYGWATIALGWAITYTENYEKKVNAEYQASINLDPFRT
jgi:hypothetical protein